VIPDGQRSKNVTITNTSISRTPGNYAQDHGIYAWGFDGLTIENSSIEGWSSTSVGGSIKVTNGDNLIVRSSALKNSGILTYTYEDIVPSHFRNVLIEDVTIDSSKPLLYGRKKYVGFLYWRNFAVENFAPAEENIVLRNVNIINLGLNLQPPSNYEAFTFDNVCGSDLNAPSGMDVSNIQIPCH
jgi:hypothetical protein